LRIEFDFMERRTPVGMGQERFFFEIKWMGKVKKSLATLKTTKIYIVDEIG